MFWTVVTNSVLAYATVITLLFTTGSLEDTLNSSFPIMSWMEKMARLRMG
jgi:hypothetical protein